MTILKKDSQKIRQQTHAGVKTATGTLDGTTTTEIVEFGGAMSKVTFQAVGSLLGTVEFSVNGQNWFSSTAIGAANAPVTYSTNNFSAMRVTRTSGTGMLAIAAVA